MKKIRLKHLQSKHVFIIVLIVFLISLVPLFYIAQYNHSCADDYSYGNHAVGTWRQTAAIFPTIQAAIEGVKTVYHTWQGSFTGVFFMVLQPAIFNESLYAFVPIIMILLLIVSTLFLLKVVLIDYLMSDFYSYGIIAIVISFLSIQFVISPVEAFYWYNGAMYYTGFYGLALVVFAIILLAIKSKNRIANVIYILLIPVLSFAVGGANFITALTSSVVMGFLLLWTLLMKRNKFIYPLVGILALLAALFISVSAPGNAVRQELFQGMNPIAAIIASFWYSLIFAVYHVKLSIYFALACITPLLYKIASNSEFSFPLPGLFSLIVYSIYSSTFTPNLYSMSSLGMPRVANVNFYCYLLSISSLILYWCGWIAKRISKPHHDRKPKKEDISFKAGMVSLSACCFLVGCIIATSVNSNTMSSISASHSLLSGEAKEYHRQNLERRALYYNPADKQPVVKPFTAKPYVLYFDDITANPANWRNIALAQFYDKDSVVLAD